MANDRKENDNKITFGVKEFQMHLGIHSFVDVAWIRGMIEGMKESGILNSLKYAKKMIDTFAFPAHGHCIDVSEVTRIKPPVKYKDDRSEQWWGIRVWHYSCGITKDEFWLTGGMGRSGKFQIRLQYPRDVKIEGNEQELNDQEMGESIAMVLENEGWLYREHVVPLINEYASDWQKWEALPLYRERSWFHVVVLGLRRKDIRGQFGESVTTGAKKIAGLILEDKYMQEIKYKVSSKDMAESNV